MKAYFITTYATQDRPQMTCAYPYMQWLELVEEMKEDGVDFYAYEMDVEEDEYYD